MERHPGARLASGLAFIGTLLLSGCGDGGGGDQPPPPAVAIHTQVVQNLGKVYLNVTASARSGAIQVVTATVDGSSLGTQDQPNACMGQCYPGIAKASYQFSVDLKSAGSATHTIVVTATDSNGESSVQTSTATFNDLPLLSLDAPVSGQLVNNTLTVSGTFGTNKSGVGVTLALSLGNVQLLKTGQSPFSASSSLSGFAPGDYVLSATATDDTGQVTIAQSLVTVTSSAALAYQPMLTDVLDVGAVSGASIEYRHYGPTTPTSHVQLTSGAAWAVPLNCCGIGGIDGSASVTDDGYVFATAGTGVVNTIPLKSSIYMWPPGGMAGVNLSATATPNSSADALLSVHFPWVLWQSGTLNELVLYNVMNGQQFNIAPPAGYSLGNSADFATVSGQLAVFYWVSASQGQVYNVMQWSQGTGASVALTSDNLSHTPQTDGVRVAWYTDQAPPPQTGSTSLTVLNLATSSKTVLSTNVATPFQLNTGLLGWLEKVTTGSPATVTAQKILSSDGTTTYSISTQLDSVFYGCSGGYIVFEENGQLYAWSVALGRTLLFDAAPDQVYLGGKTVYFTNGRPGSVSVDVPQAVYGVTLN